MTNFVAVVSTGAELAGVDTIMLTSPAGNQQRIFDEIVGLSLFNVPLMIWEFTNHSVN